MLLALDLATKTGWCVGDGSQIPVTGLVTMPDTGEDVGPFLDFYLRWLNLKITDESPTTVMMEAPVMARAKLVAGKLVGAPQTIATTRKLQGLAGVTEMVAFQRGVKVREAAAATSKKTLTGNGRADKPDMVKIARRLGLPATISFDEADAFGAWLEGVKYYAKPWWPMWLERLQAQQ